MIPRVLSWTPVLLLLLAPQFALAEPVTITAGSLEMRSLAGHLSLVGQQGFRFDSSVHGAYGIFEPAFAHQPGELLSLRAGWSGNDLPGVVSFRGEDYPVGGFSYLPNTLLVEFGGGFVVPPVTTDEITVFAPFTFSGFFIYSPSLDPRDDAVRVALRGFGTAAVRMRALGGDGGTPAYWNTTDARYDFAPIPEPSTVLLVAGGAAAALGARRRRRSD